MRFCQRTKRFRSNITKIISISGFAPNFTFRLTFLLDTNNAIFTAVSYKFLSFPEKNWIIFPKKFLQLFFPEKKTSSGRLKYWSFVNHAKNLSIKIQEISLETMKENLKYWVSPKTFQKFLSARTKPFSLACRHILVEVRKKLFYLWIFFNFYIPQFFFCIGRLPFWQRCRQIVRKIAGKWSLKKYIRSNCFSGHVECWSEHVAKKIAGSSRKVFWILKKFRIFFWKNTPQDTIMHFRQTWWKVLLRVREKVEVFKVC